MAELLALVRVEGVVLVAPLLVEHHNGGAEEEVAVSDIHHLSMVRGGDRERPQPHHHGVAGVEEDAHLHTVWPRQDEATHVPAGRRLLAGCAVLCFVLICRYLSKVALLSGVCS